MSEAVEIKMENDENMKVEGAEGTPAVENDPFAYLERGEFSSENFKIEIKNLPRFYGINELKKLLNEKLKLSCNKVKTPRRNSRYAFVCFRNDEDRDKAIETLKNYKWKGRVLQAEVAKPAPDPLVKRRNEEADEENSNKKIKVDDRPIEERLKDSTIPYWNIEYAEQLKLKEEHIKRMLKGLSKDLHRSNPGLRKYYEYQQKKYDGLPCELLNIRYTDSIDGYRNKCEFNIGINKETNLPTVGFRAGAYVQGITEVGPVDNLKHIPDIMKNAVNIFQEYIRSSNLACFNVENNTGHFKQLMARCTRNNQLMLSVGVDPQDLPEEKLKELKDSLVAFFAKGPGKAAKVTSLYYQKIVKRKPGEPYVSAEHLWGETHIYETVHGLKFRISPEAFFQINTDAAELLYETTIEMAQCNEKTTLLDVCCGTGTIGLLFAKKCSQVLGLEYIPQAIIDAKENATANNIENCEFFMGRAEDILGTVCFKATGDDIVAVLDPPRAGLQTRAMLQMRKIPKIKKVLYISCNPYMAKRNLIDLGRPVSKTVHGDCFVPVQAIAIDMFPHTKHCELIMRFERYDDINKEFLANGNNETETPNTEPTEEIQAE